MKILSIRLDDNLYKRIENYSTNVGIPLSSAVRGLIARGLKTIENQNGTIKEKIYTIELPAETFGNIEIHVIKRE